MIASVRVFLQFLYRDLYVFRKRITFYLTNYCLLYPLNYILTFAYLMPQTVMSNAAQAQLLTITLLSGNVMLMMLNLSFNLLSPILYDLEQERYIDFQLMQLRPSLILLEHILFCTLFSSAFLSPFFVISKLVLGNLIDTRHTSWLGILGITLLGCLCTVSYTLLALCIMKSSRQMGSFWVRINIPLFVLGGFWVPWHTMYDVWPALGYLMLANPLIYITEGFRRAATGSDIFFSLPVCTIALLLFSITFYGAACYFIRRKIDPVL